MDIDVAIDIMRQCITVSLIVGGPIVVASLIVGILLGILQAATQVNDQAIPFAAKVGLIVLVLALGGSWMLGALVDFVKIQFSDFSMVLRK